MMRRLTISLFFSGVLLGIFGATAGADGAAPPEPASSAVEAYVPGLGDFMTAYVQPHHIKLWLAVRSSNWQLAAYEANELGETFEDISTYQGTWKSVPIAQLVKSIIEPALKRVDVAIEAKDVEGFKPAYAILTAACNACHRKAQHEFLMITVPTANPFSDQKFRPH